MGWEGALPNPSPRHWVFCSSVLGVGKRGGEVVSSSVPVIPGGEESWYEKVSYHGYPPQEQGCHFS